MSHYIGRFAPSPSGPLHMGSLLAALVSYIDAKANSGLWLVRIEDIDPPREQKGAKALMLETLSSHGFVWDGTPVYQSTRSKLYEDNLAKLMQHGNCYQCPCSRQELKSHHGKHSPECAYYSTNGITNHKPSAIRFRAENTTYQWNDVFLGHTSQTVDEDFVLKRKDQLYAYQLAVVSDDIEQNISHVIRGNDLCSSTPMQLALFQSLGTQAPCFGHFPVIVNQDHQKLSKQNLAPAIDNAYATDNLRTLARLLGISTPKTITSPKLMLEHCTAEWHRKRINPTISELQF